MASANQWLKFYLMIYCKYQEQNCFERLPIAEDSYNVTPISAFGISPFIANVQLTPWTNQPVKAAARNVPSGYYVHWMTSIYTL
jgi:hypothetical protein